MFENGGGWDSSFYGYTVTFPGPTDATNVMVRAIHEQIGSLFVKGAKYRKSGKVFSAAEGVGKPAWAMKRSKHSKRATTNWDELLTVR